MEGLGEDSLRTIFLFLRFKDIGALSLTCKSFRHHTAASLSLLVRLGEDKACFVLFNGGMDRYMVNYFQPGKVIGQHLCERGLRLYIELGPGKIRQTFFFESPACLGKKFYPLPLDVADSWSCTPRLLLPPEDPPRRTFLLGHQPLQLSSAELQVGAVIDALDREYVWYEARIVAEEAVPGRILVRFFHWEARWEEWRLKDSPMIASHRTFTRPWREKLVRGSLLEYRWQFRWYPAVVLVSNNTELVVAFEEHASITVDLFAEEHLVCPYGIHISGVLFWNVKRFFRSILGEAWMPDTLSYKEKMFCAMYAYRSGSKRRFELNF